MQGKFRCRQPILSFAVATCWIRFFNTTCDEKSFRVHQQRERVALLAAAEEQAGPRKDTNAGGRRNDTSPLS
jgi:hypothetical protein